MKNLYEIISNIGYYLEKIIGSQEFILLVSVAAIIIKIFIFWVLVSRVLKSKKIIKPLFLLFLVIIGSVIADSAWILVSINKLALFKTEYIYLHFCSQISWGFYVIYYQALALFIEDLSKKNNKILLHQKMLLTISSIFAAFFIGFAFYKFDCHDPSMRPQIEIFMLQLSTIYMTLILMPISLFSAIKKMRTKNTPRILQRQLKIFIQLIVTPILVADLIQTYPFTFISFAFANNYAAVSISSILITYGIFHCMKKIMNMRFLNLESHVKAPSQIRRFHFVDDFKKILDKFSQATTTNELESITKDFFSDAFSIPKNRTRLYIKLLNKSKENIENYSAGNKDELLIDNFISNYDSKTKVGIFLRKNKIMIADELEFSNFYDDNEERYRVLQLMEKISADILIPIFEIGSNQDKIGQEKISQENEEKEKTDFEHMSQENISAMKVSGYIIVEKYARINNENKNAPFYTNVERDQMLVYSNYLGNLIKLLQTRSLNQIIQQEKSLKEELFGKNQTINQYRESLEYFLQHNNYDKNDDRDFINKNFTGKKIGIIFYKNRKFEFENQIAQEFVPVKLNVHDGHPITKKLKNIATKAIEYKTQQTCFINDPKGEKLIATAIPNSEKNNVIIIIYYPEISDILNKKLNKKTGLLNGSLRDPEKQGFLLYFETTKAGKLVNDFMPVFSENLLDFKINFLKTALKKKTILLNSCAQDVQQVIEIINKINKRETMHTISLEKPCENSEILIKLFGINPVLETHKQEKIPVLETLDNTGVLFIKNIHFLNLETQKYLYEFIKYGFFTVFKGERKTFSNVRIICSCDIDLQKAVENGKFYKELFNELNKASITIPKIKTFTPDELEDLISGLVEQAIKTDELLCVLELTESEKRKLINNCPESLYELRNKINQILIKKSKQNDVYQEANMETNPELNFDTKFGTKSFGSKSFGPRSNAGAKPLHINSTQANHLKINNLQLNSLQNNTAIDGTYDLTDQQVIEAVKLGKNALKDIKIMSMLWTKFRNQNKIASLLGVNRSSINRRCKEYNLFE